MTKSTIPISAALAAAIPAADRAAYAYGAAADHVSNVSAALVAALATAEAASIAYSNALAEVDRAYNAK